LYALQNSKAEIGTLGSKVLFENGKLRCLVSPNTALSVNIDSMLKHCFALSTLCVNSSLIDQKPVLLP
jgi:hypothetical protein